MKNDPIAYRQFVDGTMRPIFEDTEGQFVLDDEGTPIYGIYFIPPEESVFPDVIIENPKRNDP